VPKLKNATLTDLQGVATSAEDAGQEAAAVLRLVEQGYCDAIPQPIQMAVALLAASATLAELARHLLFKASMQEQKAELEKTLKERAS